MLDYKARAHTYFINNEFAKGIDFFGEEAKMRILKGEADKAALCSLLRLRFKILKGEEVIKVPAIVEQIEADFPSLFEGEKNWYKAYSQALINDTDYFLGNDYKLQRSPAQHDLIESLRRLGESNHYLYFIDYVQANYTLAKFEWRARSIACAVDRFVRMLTEIHRHPDKDKQLDFLLIKGYNLMGILLMDTRGFKTGMGFMKLAKGLTGDGCTLHKDHVHRATLELDIAHCQLKLLGEHERKNASDKAKKAEYLAEVNLLIEDAKRKLDFVYAEKPHRYYAHYLRVKALYYREHDDDPQLAIDCLEKSFHTRKSSFSEEKQGHPSMSRIRNYQAHLILSKDSFSGTDYQDALIFAKEAVKTACRTDHPAGNVAIDDRTGLPNIGPDNEKIFQTCMMRALHTKALIYLKEYTTQGSSKDYALLKLAYQALFQAGRVISNTNKYLLDSASKYLLAEQTRPIFEAATAITFYLSEREQNKQTEKDFNKVYLLVQRCKSHLLLQELGSIPLGPKASSQHSKRRSQLVDYSLRKFSEQILKGLEKLGHQNHAQRLEEIDVQHKNWSNLVDPQRYCSGKAANKEQGIPKPIPISDIVKGLEDEDAAFFSYTLTPKACYGTVISHRAAKTILLVEGKQQVTELKALICKFKDTVERTGIDKFIHDFDENGSFSSYSNDRDPRTTQSNFVNQAYELYQLLFSDLLRAANDKPSRIYILPDAELWGTYFNAFISHEVDLADVDNSLIYDELPYLINDYLLTLHFSVPIIKSVYGEPKYSNHELAREKLDNVFIQGLLHNYDGEKELLSSLYNNTSFFRKEERLTADNWEWKDWRKQMKVKKDTMLIYAHGSNGYNNLATIGFNRSLNINVIDLYRSFLSSSHLLVLLSCYGNRGPLLMGEAYLSPVYSIFRKGKVMNIIYVDDVIKPAKLLKIIEAFLNNLCAHRDLMSMPELVAREQYLTDALRAASLKIIKHDQTVPADWAPIFFLGNQRSRI